MKLEVFEGTWLVDARRKYLETSAELEHRVDRDLELSDAKSSLTSVLDKIAQLEENIQRRKQFASDLLRQKVRRLSMRPSVYNSS